MDSHDDSRPDNWAEAAARDVVEQVWYRHLPSPRACGAGCIDAQHADTLLAVMPAHSPAPVNADLDPRIRSWASGHLEQDILGEATLTRIEVSHEPPADVSGNDSLKAWTCRKRGIDPSTVELMAFTVYYVRPRH